MILEDFIRELQLRKGAFGNCAVIFVGKDEHGQEIELVPATVFASRYGLNTVGEAPRFYVECTVKKPVGPDQHGESFTPPRAHVSEGTSVKDTGLRTADPSGIP